MAYFDATGILGTEVRAHAADADFRAGECALKITLTFEGSLQTGGKKSARKHARRLIFHNQLKRLWSVNPILANWRLPTQTGETASAPTVLAESHAKFGVFQFVPLITKELSVEAALEFRILRPTNFKGQNADPDNIVKTLIDSLKMPQHLDELPPSAQPGLGETPLFVLMQDDSLLSKITSINDELLEPVCGKTAIERSDTRALIDVYIRPNYPTNENIIFFSDDFEFWNHQWEVALEGVRNWSNAELKARTTQCVLRMRALASSFKAQRDTIQEAFWQSTADSPEGRQEAFNKSNMVAREINSNQFRVWEGGLRPSAMALCEELQRRVYGEPPYPTDDGTLAIKKGVLAGINPIGKAAAALEGLIRQLA